MWYLNQVYLCRQYVNMYVQTVSDGFEATNTQTRSKHSLGKAVNKVTFKYSTTVKRYTVKLLAQHVRLSSLLPCYTVRRCVCVCVCTCHLRRAGSATTRTGPARCYCYKSSRFYKQLAAHQCPAVCSIFIVCCSYD